MFEDSDEELEFWSNVPESRFDGFSMRRQQAKAARASKHQRSARPVGSRSHDDTQSVPVVVAAGRDGASVEHVDPLLRRMGTMAVVIALLVPVALALRSGDEPARDTALQPGISTPAGTPAAVVAPTAPLTAAPTVQPAPVTTFDIDALPEAIPVNTDAPRATTAPASAPKATTAATTATPAASSGQAKVQSAPAARPACAKKYTVRAGDAWIAIAKRVGVTVKELLTANAATARTAIYPGRDICLPANASTPAAAAPTTTAKPATKSAAPAPKPTTTTAPAPPAKSYSKAEVTQIIRDVWPDHLEDEALRIATRESNLIPNVKNYCCYGLFQIYFNVHKGWLAQMGVTSGGQLWDPRTNALAAYVLYQRSNSFAPWS